MTKDPTQRFEDRVADYVRYRPSYPTKLITDLMSELSLGPGSVLADLGSGTGISARLFVERGVTVFAIEPNAAMRAAAEAHECGPGFRSVAASAEETSLGDASVDAAVAFQAFHWFDAERTRAEVRRIVRPGGKIALVWNERLVDTPFLVAYEELLQRRSPDYGAVEHRNAYAKIAAFFSPEIPIERRAANEQSFDREGFFGRVFSSSYVPKEGPLRAEFDRELEALFAAHVESGRVSFRYETKAFIGPV